MRNLVLSRPWTRAATLAGNMIAVQFPTKVEIRVTRVPIFPLEDLGFFIPNVGAAPVTFDANFVSIMKLYALFLCSMLLSHWYFQRLEGGRCVRWSRTANQ